MNKRLLCHIVGNVVRVCGALMALPIIVSLLLHSGDTMPLVLSMLIALQVVLSRFLSIETPFVKIGTGFVPVMLAGSLFG